MRKLLLLLPLLALTASAGGRSDFTYIYKYGHESHMRSHGDDIDSLVRTSRRWTGEFVWLRLDGKEFLIRDAKALAQIRNAFAEMHAFEPRLRAAEERRRPYEAKSEAIEKRMDAISDQLGDDEDLSDAQRDELERRLRVVEGEYRAVEEQYRGVEREADRLEKEMDRLEKIAEQKFERIVLRAVDDGVAELVK